MDKMQYLLRVKGEVTENKVVLTYTGADEKNHKQTVNERQVVFPIFEHSKVQVIGHNPEASEDQLWLVEGPHETVAAEFGKVQVLTLAQAKELGWGAVYLSDVPLFSPPKG